jgi:hypothetical protein
MAEDVKAQGLWTPFQSGWDVRVEAQLMAEVCRRSLWQFVLHAYGAAYNPRTRSWLEPSIHKPLCDWFEAHAKEWIAWRRAGVIQQKCLMVLIPREFGKTTLITQAAQIWLHLYDPDISTYTGSETVGRAAEFLDTMKSVMAGTDVYARFPYYYGVWEHKDRPWSNFEATHAARQVVSRKEPSFGTFGVEKGITGTHPDGVFFDDPTSFEAMANNTDWLQRVNNVMDSLIPIVTADGLLVLPGTRYGDGDHFGRLLRVDGAATLRGMPAGELKEKPNGKWHVFFMRARGLDGTPVYPKKWPEWRLEEYERKNNVRYASQIMNDPTLAEFMPLSVDDLEGMVVEPRDVPANLRFSIHMDTAFKALRTSLRGDESVIQVWGHHPKTGDVYFIEGYSSDTWRAEDFLNKLAIILQQLRNRKTHFDEIPGRWPFVMTDDRDSPGKIGVWPLTMQSWLHGCGLVMPSMLLVQRHHFKKTLRIMEVTAHWVDGRVKLVRGAPGLEQLVRQMASVGGTMEHDDWADAATDVFNPDVYNAPAITGRREVQPQIVLPWDEVLRPGHVTDEEAVKLYDRYHSERPTYDPV